VRTIVADPSGVVVHIDHDGLVELAREADCCLHLHPALGDFVPAGGTLFTVDGPAMRLRDADVRTRVVLALERVLDQDIAYGFRMLVDIAERSLAESAFLDPTTAVQAIDRLHDCLRQLARRPFPTGQHRDADGELRLVVPTMEWDEFVHLAFDELRLAGASSPQVSRRLINALEDLRVVALPDRRPPIEEQLRLLRAAVRQAAEDGGLDVPDFALHGARQGIGPAAHRPADLR
jgi:uncharacterized membrane protein